MAADPGIAPCECFVADVLCSSKLACLLAQFDMFLKNSLGVLFFTFFLFQLAMSSLAFLISTMVSKASTGTNVGFAVFLIGWIMQVCVVSTLPTLIGRP